MFGNGQMINAAIAFGANPNETHRSTGSSSVENAAAQGNESSLKALILNRSQLNVMDHVGNSPLVVAASEHHSACVLDLLRGGADANMFNSDGYTPLMFESGKNGDLACVKSLIAHGAQVNAVDSHGVSALGYAVACGDRLTVVELVRAGSDVNCKSKRGVTPLMVASRLGNADYVALLIDHGAMVNQRSHDGKTALAYADAHPDVHARLLISGAIR